MKTEAWAIVPAAGRGERFSNQQDKLLAPLTGKTVLERSIEALLSADGIQGVVLVTSAQNLSRYQALLQPHTRHKPLLFAEGGASRRESVYRGLLAAPESATLVAVHDAARPLVSPALIDQAIQQAERGARGVILAVPIRDTVKQLGASGNITATLDRSSLWRAQTPQVFWREPLLQAHQAIPADHPVTDDAQLLELAGLGPVQVLESDERNLKITTQHDLLIAEALLQQAPSLPL